MGAYPQKTRTPPSATTLYSGLERDRGVEPIRDDSVIRLLGACVPDDDPSASHHAAASALKPYRERLAGEGSPPHLPDPRSHVRESAVWAIAAHGADDVTAELARLLQHDHDGKVRGQAAWALGVGGNRNAERPLLEAIAAENDAEVIEKARKSLGWIRSS